MKTSTELFPLIKPYNQGFLKTADGHQIHYEQSGDKKGFPILYVHGGPGIGCNQKDRILFSPEKRVILFDQRGCGKSRPFASLKNNTTPDLLCDMFYLLRHLNVAKAILFGGSWGSTLSLLFAIYFPKMVASLILRGIFLGEKDELDYMYNGGIKRFAPHHWERFIDNVPPDQRHRVLNYFYETMQNGTPEQRRKLAFEMSRFEEAVLTLEPRDNQEIDAELSKDSGYEAIGLLEAHYFVNNCFIEEGFILKNIQRIPRVPISIIQGAYDKICPPESAYRLFQALSAADIPSDMYFTTAGHAKSDKETRMKLISETDRIYRLITQKSS